MTNHTPAPWRRNIKPASKYPVIYAGRNTHVAIVERSGLTPEEIEANCDLIKGAPDLLQAAILAEDVLADLARLDDGVPSVSALILLRSAIAYATGN